MMDRLTDEQLREMIEDLERDCNPGNDDIFDALVELHAYRAAAPLEKVREWAKAFEEGRLVALTSYAKEGEPKPSCFYTDLIGAPWCLGLAHEGDDYPVSNCQKCWYSEYSAFEREEAQAALDEQEGERP